MALAGQQPPLLGEILNPPPHHGSEDALIATTPVSTQTQASYVLVFSLEKANGLSVALTWPRYGHKREWIVGARHHEGGAVTISISGRSAHGLITYRHTGTQYKCKSPMARRFIRGVYDGPTTLKYPE